MRKIIQQLVTGAGVLGLSVSVAHADFVDPKTFPICAAHMSPSGAPALNPDSPIQALTKACDGELFGCDITLDAVKGKPDPAFAGFFPDLMYYTGVNDKGHCVQRVASIKQIYEGAVAFGVPDLKDKLIDQIDSDEKLTELNCQAKQEVVRALWYLGDVTAADAMIASYNNLLCTPHHFNETVSRIADWPLSDAQLDAIEKTCVDGIFGEKIRNHKDALKGCYLFFATRAKASDDALEYLKMGATNDKYALMALASADPKGEKKRFEKILEEQTTDGFSRDAKGTLTKKKIKIYRGGRDETVSAAVALVAAGDAGGMAAVKYWLELYGNTLASADGFERIFLWGAPFADAATQAKLRPLLEKAFAAAEKAGAKEDSTALSVARAAVGLGQIGSNKGINAIVEAISGDNDERRDSVLPAIGGVTNVFGTFRWGRVGLKFGGKTGLQAADGQKIVDALEKKAKFFKGDTRKQAIRAMLDIKSRMKVAGV